MNLVLNTKLYNIVVSLWSVIFDSSNLRNVLITDITYFTGTFIFYTVCVRSIICHCHGNPWIAVRLWNALPIKAAASDASQNPWPGMSCTTRVTHCVTRHGCDVVTVWHMLQSRVVHSTVTPASVKPPVHITSLFLK